MSAAASSSAMALASMIWLLYFPCASSLSFSFDFSKTGNPCGVELVCTGDAHFGNSTIELTTTDLSTITIMMSQGQVWYGTPVLLWDAATGEVASFATAFSFNITRMMANSTGWGDGMTFFLARYSSDSVLDGSYGGGLLGLFDNADHLNATGGRRVVAVEFDTHHNSWDMSDQHVGIDVNSIKSVAYTNTSSSSSSSPSPAVEARDKNLTSGYTMTATVHYDNVTRLLAVDLKIDDTVYRVNATIDLRKILPQEVAVGFSAGTGSNMEHHRVLSWSFNSTLQETVALSPTATPTEQAPSAQAGSSKSKSKSTTKFLFKVVLIPLASVMVLVTLALLLWLWRRKPRETDERESNADLDFETGIGPRRYTYRELAAATDDFSAENKLGEGGFGSVYRGRLPGDDADADVQQQLVAIKRFSSESSSQGRKEFEAEVTIISRLRHRNLVQLLGWCDSPKGLLLVYELVSEGSLDEHIHSSKNFLSWPQRYKIILGLGSALHYLHLDWEQCVVHGDIKPRNIMLDSSYNTKLGDFGLARLIDHGTGPQTTGLVQGTVGYIDPEFVNTFQRSTHSDIYSFGIVLLEIVSGRLPASRQEPSFTLLRWVRSLHCQDLTLDAADPRLRTGDDDDDRQMERALVVGLWCAHPDPTERPSVAQAMHALQSEYVVGLPVLSPQMYKQLVAPPSFALGDNGASDSSLSSGVSSSSITGTTPSPE